VQRSLFADLRGNAQTAVPAPHNDGFHCNRSEDLGLFEQTEKWLPREAFVMEAQRRMAEACISTLCG